MMGPPDENSPTIPNRDVVRPPQPGSDAVLGVGGTPAGVPPASNVGPPPTWDVPKAPKPRLPGGGNGFGVGLAVALVLLAVMALGLVVVLVVNGNTTVKTVIAPTATATLPPGTTTTPTATATPLPPISADTATNVVDQYYTAISAQQFQNAYNLLSQQLQSSQTLQQFEQQWQGTQAVMVDPSSIQTTSSADGMSVTLTLTYTQILANGSGPSASNIYNASIVVGYDQGQVHILQISATQVQASPTPTATPSVTPTPIPLPQGSPTPTVSPSPTGTSAPTTP